MTMKHISGVILFVLTIMMIVPTYSYKQNLPFSDVSENAWYYESVKDVYAKGIMNGMSEDTFAPDESITCAQAVKLAVCINQQYNSGSVKLNEFNSDSPFWYSGYVDYAEKNGIITKEYPWNDKINRAEFAEIFANALSEEALESRNIVEDGAIPDVASTHPQADAIYKLYRAGVLTGMGETYNYYPDLSIRRSETCAIVMRMIDESAREDLVLFFDREPQGIDIQTADIRSGVKIPVLMYHEVSDEIWGRKYLFVSPINMKQQLQWLKNNGYETIFFSDLTHLSDYRKPVMLTFDDGYEGNYTNLFPMLKEYNMKATIFVVSDEIGTKHRLTKEQIREMSDSGLVSIQSHTKSHSYLDRLDVHQLRIECQESKTEIGKITGTLPYVLSYPEGRCNTLSDSVVCKYFTFGVLDRKTSWKTDPKSLYRITRSVIPREFTINQFAEVVRR